MLDLSSLRNALGQLKDMDDFYRSPETVANERLSVVGRGSVIQAFEFTYTVAVRTIKRVLEIIAPDQYTGPETDYRSLLLLAKEFDLIEDINRWMSYRDKRNKTSHTYAEDKATEVAAIAPLFIKDADYLLASAEKKAGEKA